MTSAREATQVVAKCSYDGACAALELLEVAREQGLVSEEDVDRLRPAATESVERVADDLPPNGGGPPRHLQLVLMK